MKVNKTWNVEMAETGLALEALLAQISKDGWVVFAVTHWEVFTVVSYKEFQDHGER